MPALSLDQRFWSKVDRRSPDECWPWLAACDRYGYGSFRIGAKKVRAHRTAYELTTGDDIEGMDIDHRCHTNAESCLGGPSCQHRRCCNPDHMVPEPSDINRARGRGIVQARKTHCPQGHPYSEENTYRDKRGRACLICKRDHARRAYATLPSPSS